MTIKQSLTDSIELKNRILQDETLTGLVDTMSNEIVQIYKNKGKLLIAGNGGSAADAQHFAAEITCQFEQKRRARPAIALSTDTSALTAWSNDYSYETTFSRLTEAHGKNEDALVVISTSGNSKNLIHAALAAHAKGMKVFGLLGRDGGALKAHCDRVVIIPSNETPRIQECHILVIHSLCSALDDFFSEEDKST